MYFYVKTKPVPPNRKTYSLALTKRKPRRGSSLDSPKLLNASSTTCLTGSSSTPRQAGLAQSAIKDQVRKRAIQELPAFTENFIRDLVEKLDDCYDLKHMVISEMTQHKEILVDLFITVGKKELKFIERSGLYFGFAFGLIQMLVYGCYEAAWVLPVFGFLVGFATNMIALKMIFAPIEPTLICGRYWLHGVFLKRQQEASAVFATKMVEVGAWLIHSYI
jgi:uncharacterized membrane protein YheB (UPF0754 family)